ncbi:hypothetical protein DFQ01_104281 [Paenibacillus cellulosilyticus]|uniref:PH (Pleckstrin Homology) domain-containing protein n=1 Tax=Paenibacillus cellulosilyticus TaxID=375489 RepID=A0A2V2Z5G4_9BACL|nr:hypothetical protein [Paenibacillus cellulosilyticus]PWW05719.1 hypothetical protein DFQ01_104281 [Paenibacillus cellulosilyticus]QKS45264.1 hypothetical protein HUB94_13200 [Paenibacillus cellulosilyticus]
MFSTVAQLKVQLVSNFILLVLMLLQIFWIPSAHKPMWLEIVQYGMTIVFLVIVACILSDLIRKDHIIIDARLIEKRQFNNGWKIRVRAAGEEKLRKFRTNRLFDEILKTAELDKPITVTYFRLTKAVFAIRRPDVDSIKD